ncbi:MAG: ABC-type transporter, periplasmic subunit family 3 [Gemmatimonadetes bacterium]|nr:ABC-type transporter, periplasmic subunit family 3 [Gemmatimonadota bacterium]
MSCDLPRDADGTLNRVRGGVLRVGVAENRPWTQRVDTGVTGLEVRLARELASELDARPAWRVGSEASLLEALKARQLDLVIGGFTASSPWNGRVAFTRPYEQGRSPVHVLATSPGENAWLVRVDQFLQAHGAEAVLSELDK